MEGVVNLVIIFMMMINKHAVWYGIDKKKYFKKVLKVMEKF